jgi:antitoxin HicB
MNIRGYDVDVQKLSAELGGGFVALAPALKGCLADGETRDEAIRNLEDAIACWLDAAQAKGRRIPRPTRVLQPH